MSSETYFDAKSYIERYMIRPDGYLNDIELIDWWSSAWKHTKSDRIGWLTVAMLELIAYRVELDNYNDLVNQRNVATNYLPFDGTFKARDQGGYEYSVIAARAVVPAMVMPNRVSTRVYVQMDNGSLAYWTGPHEIIVEEIDRVAGVDFVNGSGVYIGDGKTVAWFPFDYLKSARSFANKIGFRSDMQVGNSIKDREDQSDFLQFLQTIMT